MGVPTTNRNRRHTRSGEEQGRECRSEFPLLSFERERLLVNMMHREDLTARKRRMRQRCRAFRNTGIVRSHRFCPLRAGPAFNNNSVTEDSFDCFIIGQPFHISFIITLSR
ncbi:hypothetical protein AVEN_150348-1 [Araneus ventricosus]|uniref:Uncharacterized protein n=1 Tax=Araneus ventricosus TaxID=182803 RepID=A0A4Y2CS66_ARAVE|nr:hypothetical protein AVEN_150348-1 [Araneus ventricosus]